MSLLIVYSGITSILMMRLTRRLTKEPDKYTMQLHPVEDTQEIVIFKEADLVAEEEL